MSEFRLDWASHAAARYACEAWHYSGRLPIAKTVRVGVWERQEFIGVIVFSCGPCGQLGSRFGLDVTRVCELSRIALDKHETPVTQLVSPALGMLREHCPGMRLVISFADPAQGHVGRIYQAGNWIYLGQTSPSKGYIDPEGRLRHSRNVNADGFKSIFGRTALVPSTAECVEVKLPGKFRYAMPLDRAMRRRVLPHSQPYPQSV